MASPRSFVKSSSTKSYLTKNAGCVIIAAVYCVADTASHLFADPNIQNWTDSGIP